MIETITGFCDVSALVEWYRSLGAAGVMMAAFTMVLCALTVLPSEASAIANSMVYGPFWGGLLSWVSAMAGANIAYALARGRTGRFVTRLVGAERMVEVQSWTRDNGTFAILIAHLIPVIPFFALNYAGGLIGMRRSTFNLTTGIGILPAISVLAVMGDQAFELPIAVWIAAALLIVAMLFALKLMLRHRSGLGTQAAAV